MIFLWQMAHSIKVSVSRYSKGALQIRHSSFIFIHLFFVFCIAEWIPQQFGAQPKTEFSLSHLQRFFNWNL